MSVVTQRLAGTFWLLTFLLFLSAAVLYIKKIDWYWVPGAIGLIISQTLIVIYWQDAKFGTIANVIILVVVTLAAAKFQFDREFKTFSDELIDNAFHEKIIVTEEKLKRLPNNVQRWLRQSNVVGTPSDNSILVTQRGEMRLKPDAQWMPFTSEQYFTIDPPSFVWKADIRAASLLSIGGRDKYVNGEGNMVVKPLYIYTLADAKGAEINQGTLLRSLAEMAWFPQAAIGDYLQWEEINDHQARVKMNYKGVSASGVFTFNNEGLVSGFEAQRYGDFDGKYRLETWSVKVIGYLTLDGKKIGNKNEVTWKLKEGDFLWLKMEVTGITNGKNER